MSTVTLTGDDYRYRFEVDAKQRFIDSLRERFNTAASYKRGILKWGTLIEQKTDELGRFLTGRTPSLDFIDPSPNLDRQDDKVLRAKILALTSSRAKQLGVGRSTLHYLRRRARMSKPFEVYKPIVMKLNR